MLARTDSIDDLDLLRRSLPGTPDRTGTSEIAASGTDPSEVATSGADTGGRGARSRQRPTGAWLVCGGASLVAVVVGVLICVG